MKKKQSLKTSALYHLEAGQLVKRNINDVATAGIVLSTDPLLQNYITQLSADVALMDLALIQVQAQQETRNLELLDIKRDTSVRVLRMQLRIFFNSDNPVEVNAYNTLKLPFDAYKDIEKLNYEAENNAIDNFVVELSKPVYSTAIATLNLASLIARMTNDNTAFKNLFSARSVAAAGTAHYDAKIIRKKMLTNYDAFVNYIISLTNATNGMPTNAYYLSMFNIVDNIRKYFSDLLTRRAGGGNDPTPPTV